MGFQPGKILYACFCNMQVGRVFFDLINLCRVSYKYVSKITRPTFKVAKTRITFHAEIQLCRFLLSSSRAIGNFPSLALYIMHFDLFIIVTT